MEPLSSEGATRLTAENQELRSENERLRAQLQQLVAHRTPPTTQAGPGPHEDAELLRVAANTASVGLAAIDQAHRYRYANQAFANMVRLTAADIVGRRLADVLGDMYTEQMRARLVRAFAGERVRYELVLPAVGAEATERAYTAIYQRAFYLGEPLVVLVAVEVTDRWQMENDLRERTAMLALAQVLVRDLDSRIVLWNRGVSELYGFSETEAIGQVSHVLLRTEFPAPLAEIEAALMRDGAWSGELVHRRRDGAQVVVASQWQLYFDEQGQPVRIFEANTDISARKQAEDALQQSAEHLHMLADASRDFAEAGADEQAVQERIVRLIATALGGLCVIRAFSNDGQWLNSVALHNASPEAFDDAMIKLATAPVPAAAVQSVLQFQGKRAILLPRPDFAQMRAMLPPEQWPVLERMHEYDRIVAPLRAGGQSIGMLGIVRKRDERRPSDEQHLTLAQDLADRAALAIANAQLFGQLAAERALLAARVAERTADLSQANAELARAARLKDEFLANMSHELRTPLNAILGRSEAMRETIYGPVTERQQAALQSIEESGRHLLALINDILDLSKIEAGKLELEIEEVLVDSLCRECVRMVAQIALTKRIALSTLLDGAVDLIQADVRRLKQILVNLLSNAVKFTPEGGKVGLEVRGDAERQQVSFTVWDTGIGIAAEDLAKLFQPFTQLDSRLSRQYQGSGLGLALVRRLAEAHGGSIGVESTPGAGSRFSVTLAWARDTTTLPAPAPPQASAGPPIGRALVIEDSVSTAAQLTRYLTELGVAVETHPYGLGAVERALVQQPDVIVLDILLPNESGWEVLRQLKAEPHTHAIPVVIVSVLNEPERGRQLGAAAYLVKPVSRDQLAAVLRQLQPAAAAPFQHALIVAPRLGAAAPRILLAEDNETNIGVVHDYLMQRGYAVEVARNGAEAIERAHETPPGLILMDIQMPGMDGLEAIRRIRADPALRGVPIIALTALAMPGDRERCLEAGANDYLTKPVSLRSLLAAIAAQLGQKA